MKLKAFSNDIALDIGLNIIQLAKNRHQNIGVSIASLNQEIFLHMMNGLSVDKNHWLRRKSFAVKQFSMSTKALSEKFDGEIPYLKYGLNASEATSTAGGVPVFVQDLMVGIIAVTGLSPVEDHQLIVDVLKEMGVLDEF